MTSPRLTDPLTYATAFTYGTGGRIQSVTRADNTTEALTAVEVASLAAAGTGTQANPATTVLAAQAQATFTDPRNDVWASRLDWLGLGLQTQDVDPLADTAVTYRDPNGLAYLDSDPLGRRVRTFFDNKGNATNVVRPDDGLSTQSTFNSFAEPTQVTQVPTAQTAVATGLGGGTNPTWTYTYNTLGEMTAATDPNNNTTSYTYTAKGSVQTATDPRNHVTTDGYDTRNRLTSVTDPLNHAISYGYDAASDRTTVTDALNRTTTTTFDAMGRPRTVTDPRNAATTTAYDADGQVKSVTDPDNNLTSYTRDRLERVTVLTDPLGHTAAYGYDAAGNLTSTTDLDGRNLTSVFDTADRQTAEQWRDGTGAVLRTISTGYDAAGEVTSSSDPSSSYTFTYDARGRLASEDDAGTPGVPHVVLTYGYDKFDNLTGVGDNLGGSVAYAYDPGNRLTSASLTVSNVLAAKAAEGYDAANRLTSLTRSTSSTSPTVSTSLGYDNADRLTSIGHTSSQAGALSSFSYGYDVANQLTSYTGPEGSLTYGYDNSGELTSVSGARTESYGFDANGNRNTTGYGTTTGNRMSSDGTYNYTYDNAGNTLTKTQISNGQVTAYTWDYRNRLTDVQVKSSGGVLLHEEKYTYDIQNRRIGVWTDGTQLWTAYHGANAWADFNAAGTLTMRYLFGLGADQLLARRDGAGNVGWYLTDNLGSVRQIVTTAGGVLYAASYGTFGGLLSSSGTGGDRFGYTARELSAITGDYYYRARWYNPGAGRFLSQDPKQFQARDANLYRYVGNSPAEWTDPSGLWSWEYFLEAAVTAAVVVGAGVLIVGTAGLAAPVVVTATIGTVGVLGTGVYAGSTAESTGEAVVDGLAGGTLTLGGMYGAGYFFGGGGPPPPLPPGSDPQTQNVIRILAKQLLKRGIKVD